MRFYFQNNYPDFANVIFFLFFFFAESSYQSEIR